MAHIIMKNLSDGLCNLESITDFSADMFLLFKTFSLF